MYKEKVLVSNIQRFCVNDGPGIRTTLFLKGCNLHCPWCCNPENISFEPQIMKMNDKNIICGKWMSVDEIYDELAKDFLFYEGGGVTFSGGEPLLQIELLVPLLKRLKDNDIHICVETALFIPKEILEIATKYVDLFIVDVKILDDRKCSDVIGGNINCFFSNIDLLTRNCVERIYRIPIIEGYTFTEENMEDLLRFIDINKPLKVEILQGHNLAKLKYRALGLAEPTCRSVSVDELLGFKEKIELLGVNTLILRI